MRNPWLDLPERPPFVLPADQGAVRQFNANLERSSFVTRHRYRLQTDVLPVPYVGSPDAAVLLLDLNPGFAAPEDVELQTDGAFVQIARANLRHESTDYPFYYLDPNLSHMRGSKLWRRRLHQLIRELGQQGVSLETLSRQLICVEYFPYRSRRFRGKIAVSVPSQAYGLYLVHRAMDRGAIVVVMRAGEQWGAAVPRLAEYPYRYGLRLPMGGWISSKNCPEGYPRIVERLRELA